MEAKMMKRVLLGLIMAGQFVGGPAGAQPEGAPWVRYVLKQRCYRHTDMFGAVTYPCRRYYAPVYEPYYRRYDPRPERVYGYERREEAWSEPADCREDWRRSVTGRVHLKEESAQLDAQEAWAREMETRYGTRWSDINSAAGMTKECIGKVPNGVIQGVEATLLGVRQYVCVISATPCRPLPRPVQEEDIAKRAGEKRQDITNLPPARAETYYRPRDRYRWWRHRRDE